MSPVVAPDKLERVQGREAARYLRNWTRTVGLFSIALFWVGQPCNAQIDVYGVLTGINTVPGYVSLFDTQTNARVGVPITVGNAPQGSAITPDGRYV
jgi:hypothetical protein